MKPSLSWDMVLTWLCGRPSDTLNWRNLMLLYLMLADAVSTGPANRDMIVRVNMYAFFNLL